uniref:Tumor necrosis factor receptor superfamily member 6B n=1 Tax=Maylandia zebra TaxID=106582 RepID=A0A3P9DJ60_9CICH
YRECEPCRSAQYLWNYLLCVCCPPGTFMSAHCTATTPTQCQPCKNGHFTDLWNYLPRCLYCSNLCTGNLEVETECSPTTNRICRCKEGFYSADDFCIRHTECGPGYGVQTKGTTNTVCEKCPEGYFSSSSSAVDLCVKHQECSSGQSVLLTGSAYSDTVCGTCESLANGGMLLMLSTKNKIFFNATKFTKLFQTFSGEHPGTYKSPLSQCPLPGCSPVSVWWVCVSGSPPPTPWFSPGVDQQVVLLTPVHKVQSPLSVL